MGTIDRQPCVISQMCPCSISFFSIIARNSNSNLV